MSSDDLRNAVDEDGKVSLRHLQRAYRVDLPSCAESHHMVVMMNHSSSSSARSGIGCPLLNPNCMIDLKREGPRVTLDTFVEKEFGKSLSCFFFFFVLFFFVFSLFVFVFVFLFSLFFFFFLFFFLKAKY